MEKNSSVGFSKHFFVFLVNNSYICIENYIIII